MKGSRFSYPPKRLITFALSQSTKKGPWAQIRLNDFQKKLSQSISLAPDPIFHPELSFFPNLGSRNDRPRSFRSIKKSLRRRIERLSGFFSFRCLAPKVDAVVVVAVVVVVVVVVVDNAVFVIVGRRKAIRAFRSRRSKKGRYRNKLLIRLEKNLPIFEIEIWEMSSTNFSCRDRRRRRRQRRQQRRRCRCRCRCRRRRSIRRQDNTEKSEVGQNVGTDLLKSTH